MGHFYQETEQGVVPKHFVEMTSRPGELRPTRITDVRKWWEQGQLVVPSVTTVLDVLAKHALINWKIDQHLIQAFKHLDKPRDEGYSESDYIFDIKRFTELEMDKAPSAGTDFHKLMEQYINGEITNEDPNFNLCFKTFDVIFEKTNGIDTWEPEINFISNLGFGGQIDLSNNPNSPWIIDYKTKQTADKFKPGKMAYDDHRMQLAAYRMGIGQPSARCANVFVCLEDGQIDFHEHSQEELEKGWGLFQHALEIWKLQTNYPF